VTTRGRLLKKFEDFSRFDRIPARDGQRDILRRYSLRHAYKRAVKIIDRTTYSACCLLEVDCVFCRRQCNSSSPVSALAPLNNNTVFFLKTFQTDHTNTTPCLFGILIALIPDAPPVYFGPYVASHSIAWPSSVTGLLLLA